MMKTDTQLKADVGAELASNPAIHAAAIGVEDGLITLTGHLATFAEKHSVERAVRRVAGVRCAIDLDVKLAPEHKRSDAEIADAAILAMRWHSLVSAYRVWRLYIAACALEFESGGTGVYQIVASRRDRRRWPVPLSRSDLYSPRDSTLPLAQ